MVATYAVNCNNVRSLKFFTTEPWMSFLAVINMKKNFASIGALSFDFILGFGKTRAFELFKKVRIRSERNVDDIRLSGAFR